MNILRRFRDCTGAVAIITAMVTPVLIGVGSLSIEVSHWYLAQRVMQGAADAAVISAAAEYVEQYNANSGSPGTSYQTVGQHYALLNGFTIPTDYVCLIDPSGSDGCSAVEAVDARPIICHAPPCVVVEITQNTLQWASTRASLEPSPPPPSNPHKIGGVQAIPTPVLLARSVASVHISPETTTGGDCILALANDPEAILLHGTKVDPQVPCGIAIDGGRDQNKGTPAVGGITFQGGSQISANALTVAASTANCPDGGLHCLQYEPTGSIVPLTNVHLNTPTPDPYAAAVAALFAKAPPQGVNGITINSGGAGYTNSATCTVTLTGGTYYGTTASPAIFQVTTGKTGAIKTVGTIIDPGAYATMPTGGANYTIAGCGTPTTKASFSAPTEGCWSYTGSVTPIPNRKYCSINLKGSSGTINFPAGNYWIAGGDSCSGFCVSSTGTTITSDTAGVTFFLTNGEGSNSGNYATVGITSGTISLCAPGTNCGNTCTAVAGNPASCMLFIQNPAAPVSTSNGGPPSTDNTLTGNGDETLSGLIYFAKQTIDIGGGTNPHGCVGVIANYLDIGGSPTFADGCLPGGGIGSTVTTVLATPYLSQ